MDWNTMEVVLLENGVEERTPALQGPRGYLVGKFSEDRVIATEFPNLLKETRKMDGPTPKVTTGSSESESDSSSQEVTTKGMKRTMKKARKAKVAKPKGIFKRPAAATLTKQAVLNSF